jgi:NAD-dependent dihydropyrimidine dehydrogenase PreA subunit
MPIDPEFQGKLKAAGDHNGHAVWGENGPPAKLGIHGTMVAVDHDICDADEICVSVCPVNVFEIGPCQGERLHSMYGMRGTMSGKGDQDNSPFLNAQIPILNGRRVSEVYASAGNRCVSSLSHEI